MPQANQTPCAPSLSSPWRVLLADDAASMRKSLATAIRSSDASIEIIEALTGRQALEALVERSPDIAFVNLHLPEITGAEAIAWASRRGIRPLTILMSGRSCRNGSRSRPSSAPTSSGASASTPRM